MQPTQPYKLAFVDDHTLFRRGMINLISHIRTDVTVLFEVDSGQAMQEQMAAGVRPDMLVLDINMPGMDGFACVHWLQRYHPTVKVLVLSMVETEESIVRMLRMGVMGYLGKDAEPAELSQAIGAVAEGRRYYSDVVTGKMQHSIQHGAVPDPEPILPPAELSEQEVAFVRLASSDLTYAEIARQMCVSPRTVENYRQAVSRKLQLKSRVGIALYAVKHGLV